MYSWKRWKLGLLISCVTGIFSALATLGLVKDIGGWQQFVLILAIGIGKDGLLFLKQFPIESLPPDKDLNGLPNSTKTDPASGDTHGQ